MLSQLQSQGCALYIVSLGFTGAIRRHLDVWGLSQYFPPSKVFDQDSPLLIERDYVKASLIEHLMARRAAGPLATCSLWTTAKKYRRVRAAPDLRNIQGRRERPHGTRHGPSLRTRAASSTEGSRADDVPLWPTG